MIFVTVGSDVPFDRMVRVVDEWAGARKRKDVFAQISRTDWRPSHIEYCQHLEPAEFTRRFTSASAIVAHAGMGTILTALHYEKPILVMPRRGSLRETRNDHQVATAKRLHDMGKVTVAFDEQSLWEKLDRLGEMQPSQKITEFANQDLLAGIRGFIHQR